MPPGRSTPKGARTGGQAWLLRGGALVVAEIEIVEVGGGAVRAEVDAGFDASVGDEGVLVERDQSRGEDGPHEGPQGGAQRLLAAGEGVAQLARHPLAAEGLRPRDAVGVKQERRAQRASSWAMPCSGSGSSSARCS